jgi:hypothetical protein
MFVCMKHRVVRFLAAVLLALIASGLPLVQIAQATECAGSTVCGG